MYITESKTLNDFNEVQFIGVLYPAITGRAWMILRGLHVCIVLLDDRLFERDGVDAAAHCAAGQPSQIYCHRRGAGLGLDRRKKAQDTAGERGAVGRLIAMRKLYQVLRKATRAAVKRGGLDCLLD